MDKEKAVKITQSEVMTAMNQNANSVTKDTTGAINMVILKRLYDAILELTIDSERIVLHNFGGEDYVVYAYSLLNVGIWGCNYRVHLYRYNENHVEMIIDLIHTIGLDVNDAVKIVNRNGFFEIYYAMGVDVAEPKMITVDTVTMVFNPKYIIFANPYGNLKYSPDGLRDFYVEAFDIKLYYLMRLIEANVRYSEYLVDTDVEENDYEDKDEE